MVSPHNVSSRCTLTNGSVRVLEMAQQFPNVQFSGLDVGKPFYDIGVRLYPN